MYPNSKTSSDEIKIRKRGRKKQLYWKRHVFLAQRSKITSMPSKYECNVLKDMGLGESNKIVVLNRRWNISRARQYLCRMYPMVPLSKIGFDIAKCDKMRRLTVVDVDSVANLETEVRSGVLILIPHSDITLPLPQVTDEITIKSEVEELLDTEMVPSSSEMLQADLHICPRSIVSIKSELTSEDDGEFNNTLDTLEENGNSTITNISTSTEVDRENILKNFLNVYETDLPDYLTEEMFTLFWKAAEREYFRGESAIVPFVPINRIRKDRNVFKTLGKILGHMWMTTATIPFNIARTTYLHIGNPLRDIPDSILLEDMLLFITQEERVLIEKALKDFSRLAREERSLIDSFFISNGYYESLNTHEFREQLLSLASDLIICKPKELVIQMRKGFPTDSLSSFLNILDKDEISLLLVKQKPTVQKVFNILSHASANLTNEELKVLYYLQMYVKSLVNDNELLLKFIFFVSGTVQMPNQICIKFNNITGPRRQIVTNKSTCTLELSYAYNCYQEFKRELNSYLSSCLF